MLYIFLACGNGEKSSEETTEDTFFVEDHDTGMEPIATEDTSIEVDTAEVEEEPEEEGCNVIQLLHQNADLMPELWEYDSISKELLYAGPIQCDFRNTDDYMESMTGDDKGNLWLLSGWGEIFRLRPDTMECQSTGIDLMADFPFFVAKAIAFATKNQQADHTFYISGYNFVGEDVENVVAKIGPEEFSVVSSFDVWSGPLELAASRDGGLYGFQPIEGSYDRVVSINTQTGENTSIWEVSTGVELGFSFVYTLGKYMLFSVHDDYITTLTTIDATGEHTTEDSFDLSIIGAAVSSCFREDVAY